MKRNVEEIKKEYPRGCKIVCDFMKDEQEVPPGTKGKVWHVDSVGTIHMFWENGSTLGLINGVDRFHKEE